MTGPQVNQMEEQGQDWTEIRSRRKQKYQGPERLSEPERNSRPFTWVKKIPPWFSSVHPSFCPSEGLGSLEKGGGTRNTGPGPPPQLPALRLQPTTLRTRVLRPPQHVRAGGGGDPGHASPLPRRLKQRSPIARLGRAQTAPCKKASGGCAQSLGARGPSSALASFGRATWD